MRGRGWLLAIACALGCGGPVGPFPGGALSGEVAPLPGDASVVGGVPQVQLETNPAEPHSVNTWIAAHAGALYVPTSMIRGPKLPTERAWVRNVEADDRVRLRAGESIYALRAERVLDDSERAAALAALQAKYELGQGDLDPEREIWIFRLAPR